MITLDEIPNIVNTRAEIEATPDGVIQAILVVETDLEINAMSPGYHKAAVDQLLGNLYQFVRLNPHHAGKIRIVTRR